MARPRKQYRLYRRRYRDKKSGKVRESLNYKIEFRDHLQITRQLTAVSDRSVSEYLARNIIALVSLRACNQALSLELKRFVETQPKTLRDTLLQWGVIDAGTNAGFEPLVLYERVKAQNSKLLRYDITGGHVYYWQKSMVDRGLTSNHIRESVSRVVRLITGCGFVAPSDMTKAKVQEWLAATKDQKGPGVANGHLKSFKVFCNWMQKNELIIRHPFKDVAPFRKLDKERERRALDADEIDALMTVVLTADKHHGLRGCERYLVYKLALRAGLRYNEIYTLRRMDIAFSPNPKVTVTAGNAKNRKPQPVPLSEDLAKELKHFLQSNSAKPLARVFSHMWKDAGAEMLRPDLELAGIEYRTQNRYVDFHSLRHTCGTMLAEAGVYPKVIQEIMRHSDINLTMARYTHLRDSDMVEAVNRIARVRIIEQRQVEIAAVATPDDLTANLTENSVKTHKDLPQSAVNGVG